MKNPCVDPSMTRIEVPEHFSFDYEVNSVAKIIDYSARSSVQGV